METAGRVLEVVLREPLALVLDPSERTYWVHLASALLLAGLVHFSGRSRGHRPRRTWSHASSVLDYQLILAKILLRTGGTFGWAVSAYGLAIWTVERLDARLGVDPIEGLSTTQVALAYTLVLFLLWDLSRYAFHRLMHSVPALWEIHQVHHSAEVLTPFTLYRSHPVEGALYALRGILVTGLVSGVFFHLFRRDAVELQLLGVNALGFLFNVAGGNLRHSHVWLSWGPRLERWLISPAQHQLHHASAAASQRRNYGTWLAIWDRLGGSLELAGEGPPVRFGLTAGERNHDPHGLASALLDPLVGSLRRFRPRRISEAGIAGALVCLSPGPARAAPPPAPEDPRAGPPPTAVAYESADAPRPTSPPKDPADVGPDAVTQAPEDATPTDTDADEEEVFEIEVEEPDVEVEVEPDGSPPPPRLAPGSADVEVDTVSVVDEAEPREPAVGSIHTVDKTELERFEHDDVHRVLRSVPGVYVRGEDGYGLRPNIGLRGANSDRSAKVTLMEDEILLGPAPYSAPAAYYFPVMTRMVSVDVIKGPGSIRHGPNTIGGAVNLRTRDIPGKSSGAVDAGVGMRGYGKVHGYWGASSKRLGFLVEGVRVQTNGFKELDGGGPTGFYKNEAMLKARAHNDPGARVYHEFSVKGGFANELSHETYLGLSADDFNGNPYRRYASSQKGRMKWWRSQGQAQYFLARGDMVDFQATAYRHDFHRAWRKLVGFAGGPDLADILRNPTAGQAAVFFSVLRGDEDSLGPDQTLLVGTNDRRFVSEGIATVAHVRPRTRHVDQDIEIGARFHHDQIRRNHTEDGFLMASGTLIPEGTPTITATLNRGIAMAGAFHLRDQITIIDRVTIVPGIRMEVIHTEFENDLANTSTSANNFVALPGGGLNVRAARWLDVLAGVHAGFSPVAPGQPDDVKPERSVNYEAGFRAQWKGTRGEAIGFFNDYSNLTGQCTFSAGCSDAQNGLQFNAGAVHVAGLEAVVGHHQPFRRGLYLDGSATYTFTWSRFRTTFSSGSPQFGAVEAGDALPYVPVHQVAFQAGGGGRRWSVHTSGTYVGEMRDLPGQGDIPEDERIPGYFVLDLAARAWLTDRLSLYSTLTNVTANRYMISLRPFGARPGRPIAFMVGVNYTFG